MQNIPMQNVPMEIIPYKKSKSVKEYGKREVRKVDLLKMAAAGYNSLEVAGKIGNISARTVESIYFKMCLEYGVCNKTALVAFALRNKIIE